MNRHCSICWIVQTYYSLEFIFSEPRPTRYQGSNELATNFNVCVCWKV